MGAFISLSEYPFHGSLGRSRYPGEWDDQQVMSPTRVRFTPASGALSGVDTWFYYYRGLNDLISAGGISQIGVKTAAVATFDGFNWNDQRAINPVIENDFPGAPAPVAGGLYNDMRAVVYAGKIRLFVAIYGNPSESNRTVIFESADGFTFTYVGEAQKDAAYLGRTIGAIANVGGTLVSLVSIANGAGGGNGRQKWVSTDGGLTWLERGLAIPVGIEGDWNGLTYLGGTMELIGDYYVALLHGMPFIGNNGGGDPYLDWPEAFGAFRIHVDDILTADVIWEANAQNPLFIAGPTHGATWHAALYQHNGSTFVHMETWGVPGFENIGNATNMALRDTSYFGVESRVSSAQIYMLEMKDRGWLDNWTTPILADGDYTLRHVGSGKFVGIVSGAPVPVIDDEGEIAKFTIDRQLSYYRFRNGGVSMRAPSEFAGSTVVMEPSPGVLTNQAGQWDLTPWGDPVSGGGRHVVITNRYTRMALALTNGTEADGSPLVCLPFTGDPAQVFEIMPYRPSSTTTEFPDPENPMLNMTLPAGDLVGTTEPQNLANKTLALAGHTGSIAQLITAAAAGDFDDLDPGSVVWAGGCAFRRKTGAAYAGLPVGFVPMTERFSIKHFIGPSFGTADAYAALAAAVAYLDTVVNGELWGDENTYYISQTIVPNSTNKRAIYNLRLKPHPSWISRWPGDSTTIWGATAPTAADYTAYPLILLPTGGGNITVEGNFLDGRNVAGVPVADGILWQAGGNTVSRNTIRGFPNFGLWVNAGTDGFCKDNDTYQWSFSQTENGLKAKRTAAALVIGTGDISVDRNNAHGCLYPFVACGTGACTILADHYYNGAGSGDVLTSGKTYNAKIYQSARPDFLGTYFDKGIVRLENFEVQFQSCRFLTNDGSMYDPFFFEFAPQGANTRMSGLMIHGCDFQGSVGGAALSLTNLWRVNTALGTLKGDEDCVIVENNTYHKGTLKGLQLPSTSGSVRKTIATASWTLDTGAYKNNADIDLADYLFLPTIIAYNLLYSAESNAAAKPYTLNPISMQKVSGTSFRFWASSAQDVKMHIAWEGRSNVLL